MNKVPKSLITVAGLSVVIGVVAFVAPTQTQGPGSQQPLNVNVINTPTVHEARKEPFNDTIQFGHAEGDDRAEATFQVPSGKQLVVTYISADLGFTIPAIGQTARFSLRAGDGGTDAVLHKLVSDVVDSSVITVNEPLELRLDAGDFLSLFIRRSGTTGSTNATFNVSGYLLQMPQ
jgi:hypothetical protein